MPISTYLRNLRAQIGHDLIFVPSVTVIIFDTHERVLLARHRDGGLWVAPGGSVDPLECPADAAVREIWEETGLWITPIRIVGVYGGPAFRWTYANGDEVAYQMTVFEGRIRGGQLRVEEVELFELAYFSAEDARTLQTAAWLPIVLADALQHRQGASFQPVSWQPPTEQE